jgi:IS30 family transposase
MPARRELTMRLLRQMLRLHHDGVSAREIGRTLGVARSTIQDNLERARAAGIGWPLPAEWTDEILEQRLFARSGVKPGRRREGRSRRRHGAFGGADHLDPPDL